MISNQLVDHYEVLQISPNADQETVQRVFRLLAQRFHPDNQATGNAARFRELHDAYQVLNDNRDILDRLAGELLDKETLDAPELVEIFKDVRKLPERPQWLSSDRRPVSNLPAIEFPGKAASTAAEQGDTESSSKPRRRPFGNPGIAPA